jgi:hypothetical protein
MFVSSLYLLHSTRRKYLKCYRVLEFRQSMQLPTCVYASMNKSTKYVRLRCQNFSFFWRYYNLTGMELSVQLNILVFCDVFVFLEHFTIPVDAQCEKDDSNTTPQSYPDGANPEIRILRLYSERRTNNFQSITVVARLAPNNTFPSEMRYKHGTPKLAVSASLILTVQVCASEQVAGQTPRSSGLWRSHWNKTPAVANGRCSRRCSHADNLASCGILDAIHIFQCPHCEQHSTGTRKASKEKQHHTAEEDQLEPWILDETTELFTGSF